MFFKWRVLEIKSRAPFRELIKDTRSRIWGANTSPFYFFVYTSAFIDQKIILCPMKNQKIKFIHSKIQKFSISVLYDPFVIYKYGWTISMFNQSS